MTKILAESHGLLNLHRVYETAQFYRYEAEQNGKAFTLYFPKEVTIGRYGPDNLEIHMRVLDKEETGFTPTSHGIKYSERVRIIEARAELNSEHIQIQTQLLTNLNKKLEELISAVATQPIPTPQKKKSTNGRKRATRKK